MESKVVIFLGSIKKVELVPKMGREWEMFPEHQKPHLREETITMQRKEFFRHDLPLPDLEVKDKFFITEMGLVVTILDKMRSSSGNTVYVTNCTIEITQPTEEERENANKLLEKMVERAEQKKKESLKRIKKEEGIFGWMFK